MKKEFLSLLILCITYSCSGSLVHAQEKVFAGYFDIPFDSPAGTIL